MNERIIAPEQNYSDEELQLRPNQLDIFIGQEKLKENLKISIEAALHRQESLDHVLFAGPPGLGKTTLSNIIAEEMNSKLHITSGPILDKGSDLAGILTSLQEGDILFIDEIHRMPRVVEEYLYSAMEDFRLDIMVESGANAKSISLPIKPFTLVGATTKSGSLSSPLRDRFGLQFRLSHYSEE
jgi:Holliday junction DNA helicase RuvB